MNLLTPTQCLNKFKKLQKAYSIYDIGNLLKLNIIRGEKFNRTTLINVNDLLNVFEITQQLKKENTDRPLKLKLVKYQKKKSEEKTKKNIALDLFDLRQKLN